MNLIISIVAPIVAVVAFMLMFAGLAWFITSRARTPEEAAEYEAKLSRKAWLATLPEAEPVGDHAR